MIGVGFEPTPPKRLVPKTSALDRSAIQPQGQVCAAGSEKKKIYKNIFERKKFLKKKI